MNVNVPSTAGIRIQAYTLSELATIYSVSNKTIKVWLKPFHLEIGDRLGRFYYPKQIKTIFEKLGLPATGN